jgi:hypothetical protein
LALLNRQLVSRPSHVDVEAPALEQFAGFPAKLGPVDRSGVVRLPVEEQVLGN